MTLRWMAVAAVAVMVLSGCGGQPAARPQLAIYAAASLTAPFTELAEAFAEANPQVEVLPIVADGSSTLATQVIEGAPADVFASADRQTMDRVEQAGLLATEPAVFATNTLQIAVAPGNPLNIRGLSDLTAAGLDVVLCAPEAPCGAAAATLLAAAGVRVVPASEEQNVTAVATKVRLGEADAGLVYATDVRSAAGELDSVVIANAGLAVNRYAIAVVRPGDNAAQDFVAWVLSAAGQAVLAEHGFGKP